MARRVRFSLFFPLLSPSWRSVAVRRRRGAYQHCSSRLRLAYAGSAATGDGLAPVTTPADDSISVFRSPVAERSGWVHFFDDFLRLRGNRDFSPGARRPEP